MGEEIMKLTVNRSGLYKNLKSLSSIPIDDKDPFNNKVFLTVDGDYLALTSGSRSNMATIYQPLIEGEEGECCISFDLMKMAKLTKDTDFTLKVEKRMSISGDKGFKGTLAVIPNIFSAYSKLKEWRNSLPEACVVLNSNELQDLARMSLEFPAFQESRWMSVMMNEEGAVYGGIQENELGSIDYYPFSDVDGNSYTEVGTLLTLDPESILSQLTFVGSRVKLSLPSDMKSPVCVSAVDHEFQFGVIFQKSRPGLRVE
jgi:hypothetical protein